MTAEDVIKKVGAVGSAVAGYWFVLAAAIAPPDSESMAFFSIACGVAGLILGGGMIVFRARIDGRLIVGLVVLATLVGGGALFRYEHHRTERTALVDTGAGTEARVVVTEFLSPLGFAAVIDNEVCSEQQVISRPRLQVTFACAKHAANEIPAADPYLFDAEERRRSDSILVGWYRLAAASLMLALFLVIDFFLAEIPSRVRGAVGGANRSP